MPCIPKHLVQRFVDEFESGRMTADKLEKMGDAARRGYFAKLLGEANSEWVNASFEKHLVFTKKEAMLKWANEMKGLKPRIKRDLVTRILRNEELLKPTESREFMHDLVKQRLGASVTMEEASNLLNMAKEVERLRALVPVDYKPGTLSLDRMRYGMAEVLLKRYMSDIRHEANQQTWAEWTKRENILKNIYEGVINLAGVAKAMKASLDLSYTLRQGWKIALTHPEIWWKNNIKAFIDAADIMKGKNDVYEAELADVLSRPNALNGSYDDPYIGKLDIGISEESFPVEMHEQINIPFLGDFYNPTLGRLYKASRVAFSVAQLRNRADILDLYLDIAKKTGGDTKGLGILANQLTGRGYFSGGQGEMKIPNRLLFSPRFMKSNIDTLTLNAHAWAKGKLGNTAKIQSAKNSAKIIGGTLAILALAKVLKPDSVETDPTSSDAGKIRMGNTRHDFSGGIAGYVTLVSRLLSGSIKSSTTGVKRKMGTGFGMTDGGDLIYDFMEGKTSPVMRALLDVVHGRDFKGRKPNLLTTMDTLFSPINASTAAEIIKNDPSATSGRILASIILDNLGAGANTYRANIDWNSTEAKTMLQFRGEIGEKEFKDANDRFNTEFNAWLTDVVSNPDYTTLSDEDKGRAIQRKKAEIKKQIFEDFGFTYEPEEKEELPEL